MFPSILAEVPAAGADVNVLAIALLVLPDVILEEDVAPVFVPGTAPFGAGRPGVNRHDALGRVLSLPATATVVSATPPDTVPAAAVVTSVVRVIPPLLASLANRLIGKIQ